MIGENGPQARTKLRSADFLYNPGVIRIERFLERCGFHLPFLHDWLLERDNLRRKTSALTMDLEVLRAENKAISIAVGGDGVAVDAAWAFLLTDPFASGSGS